MTCPAVTWLHVARLDLIRQIITLFVPAQRHADVPARAGALNAPTAHAPPTITDRRGVCMYPSRGRALQQRHLRRVITDHAMTGATARLVRLRRTDHDRR